MVAEVSISVALGFISGLACGIMGMAFYIRHRDRKLENAEQEDDPK